MKKQTITRAITLCMLLSTVILSSGCKDSKKTESTTNQPTIVTAKLESTTTRLFYKGAIAPVSNIPVLSPVDGTVTKLFFNYGDFIKKDQNIVSLDSSKLAEDYRQAVTKYLQAKDTYENNTRSFAGTEALHKAGVISTDEYSSSKSQYETNVLNYYQSRYDLEKVLNKAGVAPAQIEQLSIVDTAAVNKLLQRHFSNVMVTAPGEGVALFPVPSDNSSGDDSGSNKTAKINIGSIVKESQLILSIGDLSGFSITLQVSEININKIKQGLAATVTGEAFPGITLHGTVTSVANQASPDQSGGGSLSTFNIVVEIPKILPSDLKIIHVGMTATIEIQIKNPPHILLPIKAVFQKNGQNMVTILDPTTKQQKEVVVVPGETTLSDVNILEGVKAGDQVVLHD